MIGPCTEVMYHSEFQTLAANNRGKAVLLASWEHRIWSYMKQDHRIIVYMYVRGASRAI